MLKPLQAQLPLGQFDGLDTELTTLLGGEVVGLTGVLTTASDKKAKDVDDGYVGTTTKYRPVVTKTLVANMRPLFLADEGTANYGTILGQVVGGTVGQIVTGGAQLGPHTATGSGKVTLWDKPGLYAVTLDAVLDDDTADLVPENTSLAVGDPLYATSAGLLTPNNAHSFESPGASAPVVARFVEFQTDGSLVRTGLAQVSALNSPTGGILVGETFTQAVIHFRGVE